MTIIPMPKISKSQPKMAKKRIKVALSKQTRRG